MGRLPLEFAGRKILFRIPFTMPGELVVASNTIGVQFPEATFQHNQDKPFEIHRMIPRLTAFDNTGTMYTPQPPAEELEALTRIRIYDISKNENLNKNAQLFSTLTKGTVEKTWEWAEPYTLVRSEGFQVTIDNLATLAIINDGTYDRTRVEVSFQGFLIVVASPSDVR